MNRWPVIVALLHSPAAESRRLAHLLTRWPHVPHQHLVGDDCLRRRWLRGNAQTAR